MRGRRAGVTAVEVLVAATLLVVLILPIHSLFRTAHRGARVGNDHSFARRMAYRLLDRAAALDLAELRARAASGSAGAAGWLSASAGPAGGARVLDLGGLDGEEEAAAEGAPGGMLEGYARDLDGVTLTLAMVEAEPGLARLLVHARWRPGFSRAHRELVVGRFVSSPFHHVRGD